MPNDIKITGINRDKSNLPKSALVVAADVVIPIEVLDELLVSDITENCDKINAYLREKNITISQEQFEALVIYRFNRGSLSNTVMELLENGNNDPNEWKKVWSGGENRQEVCQELFGGKIHNEKND